MLILHLWCSEVRLSVILLLEYLGSAIPLLMWGTGQAQGGIDDE